MITVSRFTKMELVKELYMYTRKSKEEQTYDKPLLKNLENLFLRVCPKSYNHRLT